MIPISHPTKKKNLPVKGTCERINDFQSLIEKFYNIKLFLTIF